MDWAIAWREWEKDKGAVTVKSIHGLEVHPRAQGSVNAQLHNCNKEPNLGGGSCDGHNIWGVLCQVYPKIS